MATDVLKALENAAAALERLAANSALTTEAGSDEALSAATQARKALAEARTGQSA